MKISEVVGRNYHLISQRGDAGMSKILHITSGDIAGDKLAQSGLPGEVFVWHDILYTVLSAEPPTGRGGLNLPNSVNKTVTNCPGHCN
jgi:hypothetical protein